LIRKLVGKDPGFEKLNFEGSALKKLVLVDTCSFIDYFKKGEDNLIPVLASKDAILLSKIVRLELLKGTKQTDRHLLINFFEGLNVLTDFPDPHLTEKYMLELHGRGFNLGIADLLILSDTIISKASLLTSDKELVKAARFMKITVL
jgi:predicted nucleic acid-binding protein